MVVYKIKVDGDLSKNETESLEMLLIILKLNKVSFKHGNWFWKKYISFDKQNFEEVNDFIRNVSNRNFDLKSVIEVEVKTVYDYDTILNWLSIISVLFLFTVLYIRRPKKKKSRGGENPVSKKRDREELHSEVPIKHQKKTYSISERKQIILSNLNKIECLKDFSNFRVVGEGTVGTVLLSCQTYNSCVAIKIQLLEDTYSFNKEIMNQKAFEPYAPYIYNHCIERISQYTFGIIIMEPIESELDEYLTSKRPTIELKKISNDIASILLFLRDNNITHGDTALFNIACVQRENNIKWILIDFDRASTDMYNDHLDIFRLVLEWYDPSNNTKNINAYNLNWIIQNAIPVWKSLYPFNIPDNIETLVNEWEHYYLKYCKEANVLCLE